MGKRRTSLASWIDLLGYGKKIGKANFDPFNEKAKEPHDRLEKFHETIKKHAKRKCFPTLVLNDGVVAYRDLFCDDASDTRDFFHRSLKLYLEVNENDSIGARMVLASGFRNLGDDTGNEDTRRNFCKIFDEYKNCNDLDQATEKLNLLRPPYAILPQLQENFAFSKAYTAERSGSKGNLPGPNLYVDLNIFKFPKRFTPHVEWSSDSLKLTIKFAKFSASENNNLRRILQDTEMNNVNQVTHYLEDILFEQTNPIAICKNRVKLLEDKIKELENEINQLRAR